MLELRIVFVRATSLGQFKTRCNSAIAFIAVAVFLDRGVGLEAKTSVPPMGASQGSESYSLKFFSSILVNLLALDFLSPFLCIEL